MAFDHAPSLRRLRGLRHSTRCPCTRATSGVRMTRLRHLVRGLPALLGFGALGHGGALRVHEHRDDRGREDRGCDYGGDRREAPRLRHGEREEQRCCVGVKAGRHHESRVAAPWELAPKPQ